MAFDGTSCPSGLADCSKVDPRAWWSSRCDAAGLSNSLFFASAIVLWGCGRACCSRCRDASNSPLFRQQIFGLQLWVQVLCLERPHGHRASVLRSVAGCRRATWLNDGSESSVHGTTNHAAVLALSRRIVAGVRTPAMITTFSSAGDAGEEKKTHAGPRAGHRHLDRAQSDHRRRDRARCVLRLGAPQGVGDWEDTRHHQRKAVGGPRKPGLRHFSPWPLVARSVALLLRPAAVAYLTPATARMPKSQSTAGHLCPSHPPQPDWPMLRGSNRAPCSTPSPGRVWPPRVAWTCGPAGTCAAWAPLNGGGCSMEIVQKRTSKLLNAMASKIGYKKSVRFDGVQSTTRQTDFHQATSAGPSVQGT